MTEPPTQAAWRRYLRFWRTDARADVDDELAFHLEQRVRDLEATGMSRAAACDEAARRIGDVSALKNVCVQIDESGMRRREREEWRDALRMDVRTALRQLARSPVVTAVSILTLALGIGANTAIFNIVYAVLLRPLPYANADRLAVVAETQRDLRTGVGPGQFTEWVARNRVFESLSAESGATFNLSGVGFAQRVTGAMVTPSKFRTLVMPPAAGRYFVDEEATPGREHVVVLSYALFTQQFGGDAGIVGRTISLSETPYVVVGVAPPDYAPESYGEQLWVPLALTAQHKTKFNEHWLLVYGKLKPGVSLAAAQRDMERVTREIAALQPAAMIDRSVRVVGIREDLAGDYERQLGVLFGAAALILLLACSNIAGLILARLTTRRREIAVRLALGAGRARVVRLLLTESVVLAAMGGVASLAVASGATTLLLRIAPASVPRLDQADVGTATLPFVIVATLVAGLVLGIFPALRSTRGDVQQALRESGRTSSAAGPRDHARSALVVGEIALALVLMTGAVLFVRSARNLADIDPGFDPTGLRSVRVSLAGSRYQSPAQIASGITRLLASVSALLHARAVAATTGLPMGNGVPDVQLHIAGREFPPGQEPAANFLGVSPTYFETMRIPIVRGRALTANDRAGAPPVVVINEELAHRLWPNESPLGKRFYCCGDDSVHVWREIVGVSRNVRHWLTARPFDEIYVPYEQAPAASWVWFSNTVTLVMRTERSDAILPMRLRTAIAAVDPSLPLFEQFSYDDLWRRSTSTNRFAMQLFSAFAALALTLAAIGIYGVLAYLVSHRTQEIAVRMALGATRRQVFALILRQGGALAAGGIFIGIAIAVVASRALQQLLYGIEPTDPITYAIAGFALAAVALAACYVPARRAASVEPYSALRG